MAIEDSHLEHAIRTLGTSLLDLELAARIGDAVDLSGGFAWAGVAQVSGDFKGGFAIRCGTQVAEALAHGLLQETGKLSDDVLQGTLIELTFLAAGALLPLMEGEVSLAPARAMQGAAVASLGSTSKVEARSTHDVAGGTLEFSLFRS